VKRLARSGVLLSIAAAAALSACDDGRTVLVIYSPHGKELLAHYEKEFEKRHPTVDVQWLDIGSQEILDRVRAEKVNPQADVWFGAPAEMFERATKDDLFLAYKPTWAAAADTSTHDANDRWYGTYLTPEVIGYNRDAISADSAPADWDALLDPKWKGKIVIRDPVASGTMRAIFGGIILRSIAKTGRSDDGFAWLKALDAQTREYALNPTIMYQKLGRREGVITLYNMPDIATLEARTKIPIAWKVPTSGTPILVDAIAIMKGTRHRELAQQYYEFVTSRSAMQYAADSLYRIPVRSDMPLNSLPQWIREAKAAIKPMPMNRKLLADSLNLWMRRWDSEIRNSSKHS
jgi:iron(III) transport system substrate-binding protein